MLKRGGILAVLALLLFAMPAHAFKTDQPLSDPAQETRARALHKQLRCLVCQNQDIASSNAELARDLRQIVRERVAAGDSDDAVIGYLVDRYGDWVLLKPPLKATTVALWAGPLVLLLLSATVAVTWYRRGRWRVKPADRPLTEAERARLDALLDGDEA